MRTAGVVRMKRGDDPDPVRWPMRLLAGAVVLGLSLALLLGLEWLARAFGG